MDDKTYTQIIKPKLGFKPHTGTLKCPGGQVYLLQLVLNPKNRIVVCPVGRRWGKTQAAKMAIYEMYRNCTNRTFQAAYCGPTYARVKPEFDEFCQMFKGIIKTSHKTDLVVRLKPTIGHRGQLIEGGTIRFWSLDQHDNLRGSKMDFVVIDECSEVSEAAYTATLTPMTADTRGKFLLIGTPRRVGVGFMWFRREYSRAKDPIWREKGYASLRGPSEGNPYLSVEELAELRERVPDPLVRREEYDAEFLDDVGAVFETSRAFVLPYVETADTWELDGLEIDPLHDFVLGYDIGLHDDWGVISVFRRNDRKQVYLERFIGARQTFQFQFQRLCEVRKRFNGAIVIADVNGMGEVPREIMAREFQTGFRGKKWTNKTKEEEVMRGMALFQNSHWEFLSVPWQKQQFFEFTRKKMPSGVWRYEHPEGGKDDGVCASLLVTEVLAVPHVSRAPKPKTPEHFGKDSSGRVTASVDFFLQAGQRLKRRAKRIGFHR